MKTSKFTNPPTQIIFDGCTSHQQIGCAWALLHLFMDEPRHVGKMFGRLEQYDGFSIRLYWKKETVLMVECEEE